MSEVGLIVIVFAASSSGKAGKNWPAMIRPSSMGNEEAVP
jgi:hypothetical protein